MNKRNIWTHTEEEENGIEKTWKLKEPSSLPECVWEWERCCILKRYWILSDQEGACGY